MLDISYGGTHGLLFLVVINNWFFKYVKSERIVKGTSVGALVFYLYLFFDCNVPEYMFEIIDELICRLHPIKALCNYNTLLSFVENDIIKNKNFLNLTFKDILIKYKFDFRIQTTTFSGKAVINDVKTFPDKNVWETVKESCCIVPRIGKPFDGFYSYKFDNDCNNFHIVNDTQLSHYSNCFYIDKCNITNHTDLLMILKNHHIEKIDNEYIYYIKY